MRVLVVVRVPATLAGAGDSSRFAHIARYAPMSSTAAR